MNIKIKHTLYLTSEEEDKFLYLQQLQSATLEEVRIFANIDLRAYDPFTLVYNLICKGLAPTNYTLKREIAREVLEKRLRQIRTPEVMIDNS